jgi:hypothetical protein
MIGGEVSPKVYGRTDVDPYRKSCKELKNFLGYTEGGVYKRPGSLRALSYGISNSGAAQNIPSNSLSVPFSYSQTESYIITFSAGSYIQFLNTGTHISSKVLLGSAGAIPVFEGFSSDADFDKLKFTQSGDVLVCSHPDYPPFQIVRISEDFFRVGSWYNPETATSALGFEGLPYLDLNSSGITLAFSATTGAPITVTASAPYFEVGHIGSLFAINHSGTVGAIVITGFTSNTIVAATVLETLSATTATATWAEAAWSPLRGWPKATTFFESKLIYGGTYADITGIWGSQTNDVFQLTKASVDISLADAPTNADAFRLAIYSDTASEINWLSSGSSSIVVGASDAEYLLFGPDNTQSLGALNFKVSLETRYGSIQVQPVRVANRPIFVQSDGQRLRDMFFNRDEQGYISRDLSGRAEHMVRRSYASFPTADQPRIAQMVLQRTPESIVWVRDTNGALFAANIDINANIVSFHQHEFGGHNNSGDTLSPRVISMAAVKSARGNYDEVWVIVERYIDGNTVTGREVIGKEFLGPSLDVSSDSIDDHAVYMDNSQLAPKDTPKFYASFYTDTDAEISADTAAGSGTGSPAVSGHALDLSGDTVKYIDYEMTGNTGLHAGTIAFEYRPDFVGNPNNNFTLFTLSESTGSLNNGIQMTVDSATNTFSYQTYTTAGALDINIAGVLRENMTSGNISSINYITIEISYDLTAGVHSVFIGGELRASSTGTEARTGTIENLRIGSNASGTNESDAFFRNFRVSDTTGSTASHKPNIYYAGGTAVYGLDDYEGESIVALGDGQYLGEFTVSAGSITLAAEVSHLIVGIRYKASLSVLDVEDGSAVGTAQGSIGRIDEAAMRFFRTAQGKFGPDAASVQAIEFRSDQTPSDEPIELVTDIVNRKFDGPYIRGAGFYLESDEPLPCSLTSVSLRGHTRD